MSDREVKTRQTPTEGVGKRVVEEWLAEVDSNPSIDFDDIAALADRIDRALAAPRMTLDLSGVFTFPKSGKKNGGYYLSEKGLRDAIRAQLPNVDIITDKETP